MAQSIALSLTPCAGSATPWARSFSWSEAGQSSQQPRRVCTVPRGTQVRVLSPLLRAGDRLGTRVTRAPGASTLVSFFFLIESHKG